MIKHFHVALVGAFFAFVILMMATLFAHAAEVSDYCADIRAAVATARQQGMTTDDIKAWARSQGATEDMIKQAEACFKKHGVK